MGRGSRFSCQALSCGETGGWGLRRWSLSGCCCPRAVLWELLQPASLSLSAPPPPTTTTLPSMPPPAHAGFTRSPLCGSSTGIPDKLRLTTGGGCQRNGGFVDATAGVNATVQPALGHMPFVLLEAGPGLGGWGGRGGPNSRVKSLVSANQHLRVTVHSLSSHPGNRSPLSGKTDLKELYLLF